MKQQKKIDALDAREIEPVCPVALARWESYVAQVKEVVAANQDLNQSVQLDWENGEWRMRCEYTHLCDLLEVPCTGDRIIRTIRQKSLPHGTLPSTLVEVAVQMHNECRAEAIICVKAIAAAYA